jgi:hypothetical protein
MSRQVSSTLEGLASAIDHLELPVDSGVLTDTFTLADRLNAKLLAAVGEHDTAELWRNDGATSMIAWRLFCDAGIHRVITDGRSSILDYGTTTRTVPANLFNALVIRDRHCRFPGCDRPPEWTETHHPDGSPTADPPPSTTSPSSAPATTTSSTHPAGTKLLPDATSS